MGDEELERRVRRLIGQLADSGTQVNDLVESTQSVWREIPYGGVTS